MRSFSSIVLSAIVYLFSVETIAQTSVGTELNVLPSAVYKNLTYAYDSDWAWGLTVETAPKLSSSDLVSKKMVWSAFDSESKKYLFGWKPFAKNSPVFNVPLDMPVEIAALLKVQKKILIVVAQSDGTPSFYLDLGKFCNSYPKSVKNLTDTTAKACEVGDVEIPEPDKACTEYGDWLADLVKQGLISCTIAEQKILAGGGAAHPDAVNCQARKFCGE